MYILLVLATLLFASQFLLNQQFQKTKGADFNSALTFNCLTAFIMLLIMLAINKFKLEFSSFSTLMALWGAINSILYTTCSLKAFSSANLSVYSIFAMLGGMLLPFFFGIFFAGEPLTAAKILCCVLILVSLALTFQKGKSSKKAIFYYFAVFLLNGMNGVIAKIHQSSPVSVDSQSFLAMQNLISFIICSLIYIIKNKKYISVTKKELSFSIGFALACGIGNLFTLIALTELPASVQYPIITGGVMVFSTVISIIRCERPRKKEIISALIAFVSTILIAI